jgi:predicted transposase YdaD
MGAKYMVFEEMLRNEYADGKAEGRREGKIEGRLEGKIEGKIEAYLDAGFPPQAIAEKLSLPLENVLEIIESLKFEVDSSGKYQRL